MAQLPQPNNVGQALNQKLQDFSLQGGAIGTNDSALALVIQDTQRAEKFVMARLWMSEWRVAKALYDAPVKQEYWRDTLVPRAANSFPLVAQHVRAILDQTMPALFPDPTPFGIDPNEGTPRQVARGWETILSYQLREAMVKQQIRLVVKDAEVFGTGILKYGWETFTRKRTLVKRAAQPKEIPSAVPGGKPTFVHTKESDEMLEYDVDETVSRPFVCRIEINQLLVSPDLRDPNVQRAGFVSHRSYPTLKDITRLRGFEGYVIPDDKALLELAAPAAEQAVSSAMESEGTAYPTQGHRALPRYIDASEDPTAHKIEMLEYWTPDTVITVLNRKLVIRNERNPMGVIPFLSCFWDDIPGAFYSYGIPRRIGGVQTHIQGLRNKRMDDINLNLQNMWKCKKGSNIAAQPIKAYPGAVFKIDDMDNLVPIEKQPILAEAYQEEQVLIADAEKTSGANELLVQGSLPSGGRSTGMRSGTGAGAVAGASSSRVQSFVDTVADQVLIPLLYAFLKMDRLWLDPALMRKMVGKSIWESMEQDYDGDLLVDMCNNADIEFTMLAGSNIAARKNMAQSLPLEMQMYMSPAVQGGLSAAKLKVNWVEMSRRMEQASGWKSPEDIIIPMTPDDQQAAMQSNPKVLDAKATQQRLQQMAQDKSKLSAQEHQQTMEQNSAKAEDASGQDILTKLVDKAAVRDELPDVIGGFGNGAQ